MFTGSARMPRSIWPVFELLEHRRGLVLVQLQFQPRQRLVDFARHAREQIRPDRRQQRDPQLSRERIPMRRASASTSSLASRMRRARATICSPASVSVTCFGWRSMSCTPR